MGKSMQMTNAGAMVDKIARDGHEFAHVTENLRDALLAGGNRVLFGIHGLPDIKALDKCTECGEKIHQEGCSQYTEYVVRRYIADDGSGMDKETLTGVFSNFSESATTSDFDVALNPTTKTVDISLTPIAPTDNYHSRNGLGGRVTLLTWNGFGFVTVTVRDGKAHMLYIYRALDGEYMVREYMEDGIRRTAIAPYTEPTVLSLEELAFDRPYGRMLLVRSGICDSEAEAEQFLMDGDPADEIPNPLAGLQWDGDAVPEWIIHHYDEDGIARRADGAPAHGTVKFLLGENPNHHTALTGDPHFDNERDYMKYNGAGDHFWLDLTPWNVRIQALTAGDRKDSARHFFPLVGEEKHYRLQDGKGRLQVGALPKRTETTAVDASELLDGEEPATGDGVKFVEHLDLGDYGSAVVVVRKASHKRLTDDGLPVVDKHGRSTWKSYTGASKNLWATTKSGIVAVVYGDEVHGMKSHAPTDEDYQFQNMALPLMGPTAGTVSVFLFLPRASDTTAGLFQNVARERIKWSTGSGELPIKEINDTFARALAEQAPHVLAYLKDELAGGGKTVADAQTVKRAKSLFSSVSALVAKGQELLKGEKESALISNTKGSETGNPNGEQGKPGDTPREPCPECGHKIHLKTCSKYKERSGGGEGGTNGPRQRLIPDPEATIRGRTSRAKAKGTQTTKTEVEQPKEPSVPEFVWRDEPLPSLGVVEYTRPGKYLPETGTVFITRKHQVMERLYGIAAEARRESVQTRRLTERWVEARLTELVWGMLSLNAAPMVPKTPGGEKVSLEDLGDRLVGSPDIFLAYLTTLSMRDDLKHYVIANAAKKAPAKAAA